MIVAQLQRRNMELHPVQADVTLPRVVLLHKTDGAEQLREVTPGVVGYLRRVVQ